MDMHPKAAALAGSSWICNDLSSGLPVILCGDFNAGPGSFVYKTLCRHLFDIQKVYKNRRYPRPTFASWLPVRRIGHIFISRHFSVKDVKVPMNYETRMVSDHLPLYAEIAVSSP
jgi:endonuclease/exonuclease/phosphatase family metal-dependent hydrolase